jgi:hypothetical protein
MGRRSWQIVSWPAPYLPGTCDRSLTTYFTEMGTLLGVPKVECDCAQANQLEGLLGPTSPYRGFRGGSPLNNHLAEFTGTRSVVFLDEFDKTKTEVREALLKVMDTGKSEVGGHFLAMS